MKKSRADKKKECRKGMTCGAAYQRVEGEYGSMGILLHIKIQMSARGLKIVDNVENDMFQVERIVTASFRIREL